MIREPRRSAVVVLLALALLSGCNSFSDPAVRLASCIEGAINGAVPSTPLIEATCDLKQPGRYVVVLHPSGEMTDTQLIEAGMPAQRISELRALRISDNASIYVLSGDGSQARPLCSPIRRKSRR